MKGLIAVDGGGTKTEVVLADTTGRILTKKFYEGTNLNSVSHDQAMLTLVVGVREALSVAQQFDIDVTGAFFGLAGGLNGRNQQIIYNYFKPKFFSSTNFTNGGDEQNAVNVGIKNAPNGIAVIAGTGSNVGVKKDGVILPNPQLSGWGFMFDNGGSGFDYGRDAVLAAKAQANGTGEPTIITNMLEHRLNSSVFDGLKKMYDGGARFVASLAPIVFDAYRQGDKVAGDIIDGQTTNVANLINNAHTVIDSDTSAVVGLVGGIFAHEREILEPMLEGKVDENLTLTFPQENQIYGALMEAANNAGVEANDEFLANFTATYENPVMQDSMTAIKQESLVDRIYTPAGKA
ncbi:MAG: hypothetical protein IJW32_00750 [Clostridia bacterium]|nr:hypothetical protein [Clostridia bacterium]